MKVRPLVIAEIQQADIKRVMAHADVHRYSVKDIFDILGGQRKPPGDFPEFVCVVPVGYRCVYTIEQNQYGWCRHLSVSVLGEGCAPSPAAVLTLMGEFGFKGGFKDLLDLANERIPGNKLAINVIQKL